MVILLSFLPDESISEFILIAGLLTDAAEDIEDVFVVEEEVEEIDVESGILPS